MTSVRALNLAILRQPFGNQDIAGGNGGDKALPQHRVDGLQPVFRTVATVSAAKRPAERPDDRPIVIPPDAVQILLPGNGRVRHDPIFVAFRFMGSRLNCTLSGPLSVRRHSGLLRPRHPRNLGYAVNQELRSQFRYIHSGQSLSLIDRSFSEFSDITDRTVVLHCTASNTLAGRVTDESPAHPNSMDERTPCSAPWSTGRPIKVDTLGLDEPAFFPSRWGRGTIGGEEHEYLNLEGGAESRSAGARWLPRRYDRRHPVGRESLKRQAAVSRVSVRPFQTELRRGLTPRRKAVSLQACAPPPRRSRAADGHQFQFGERAGARRERSPLLEQRLTHRQNVTAALAQMCPDGRSNFNCRFHIVAGDPGRRRIGVSFPRQVYGSTNHAPAYRADRFPSLIAHADGAPNSRGSRHVCQDFACRSRTTDARFFANRHRRGAIAWVTTGN